MKIELDQVLDAKADLRLVQRGLRIPLPDNATDAERELYRLVVQAVRFRVAKLEGNPARAEQLLIDGLVVAHLDYRNRAIELDSPMHGSLDAAITSPAGGGTVGIAPRRSGAAGVPDDG